MFILGYDLGPGWIGDVSGCGYNLCFAVEPPRRGFCFDKTYNFPKLWTCPPKKVYVKPFISGS